MNTVTSTKDKKTRDSNMELLRIISMLLVLVVHASFKSLGTPDADDICNYPVSSVLRFFSESFSAICVNVFILISGWYGIRPRLKRFCEFIFQVLFFGIVIYLVLRLLGVTEAWGIGDWANLLFFRRDIWFVNAYIILYCLSPVLNLFAEHASQKQFQVTLLVFFLLMFFFGFIKSDEYFSHGYSPLAFIGIYLLARYVKMYPNKYTFLNKYVDMSVYVVATLLTTGLATFAVRYSILDPWTPFAYSSPLVVIASLYFFLFFTKISFHLAIINWIASSVFAVFLFHADPVLSYPCYLKPIAMWYAEESLFPFLFHVVLLMIVMFVVSILLDKIRLLLWNVVNFLK